MARVETVTGIWKDGEHLGTLTTEFSSDGEFVKGTARPTQAGRLDDILDLMYVYTGDLFDHRITEEGTIVSTPKV